MLPTPSLEFNSYDPGIQAPDDSRWARTPRKPERGWPPREVVPDNRQKGCPHADRVAHTELLQSRSTGRTISIATSVTPSGIVTTNRSVSRKPNAR